MRILIISSFYPPNVIGGAELCAQALAIRFTAKGHDVSVLTSAPTPDQAAWDVPFEGYRLFRVASPHIYSAAQAKSVPGWKKPLFHLQDLFDPRNEAIVAKVLDAVRPDVVNIHWIQGLGYNALKTIGARDLPTAITLHDLALVCVRTTMYRGDTECPRQCTTCRFSTDIKRGYLRSIPRLGFIAPSRDTLDAVTRVLPITDRPTWHILNSNNYPKPQAVRAPHPHPRLLFVGRFEETKGVAFILDVLEPLAERHRFTFTMLGKGPELEPLRQRFGHHGWLSMPGHVPLEDVANELVQSDLMLMPSLWKENSPGLLFQWQGASLPVMASDKGGLPELVEPGVNGFLLPAGDTAAWRDAIKRVLIAPAILEPLRQGALRTADRLDPDRQADKVLDAFAVIRDGVRIRAA